jgi:serine/threonine protein kinase
MLLPKPIFLTEEDKTERSDFLKSLKHFPSCLFSDAKLLKKTIQGQVKIVRYAPMNDALVVLKSASVPMVVSKKSSTGLRVIEDLCTEIKLLQMLRDSGDTHRNIVQFVDAFSDGSHVHLVLEYCAKGELFDVIEQEGPLTECTARECFGQLVDAVKFLHQKDIVHLDISLENIFVSSEGICKLGDFGVARKLDKKDEVLKAVDIDRPGKTSYMSPEIFAGGAYDPRKADVFSLGVVLFMLVFGFPPFEQPTAEDGRFRRISSGQLKRLLSDWGLLDQVSLEVIELLEAMFQKESERPSIEEIENHPWFDIK